MSFKKAFNTAIQNSKAMASKAIKDNMQFSCQNVNISTTNGDDTIYPNVEDAKLWMKDMFVKEFKPKVLPEKALKMMIEKGIEIAKQPTEVLLIVLVASSDTHVHVGVSIPPTLKSTVGIEEFTSSIMQDTQYEKTILNDTCIILEYPHISPLKEKDNRQQLIFEELKKRGIFVKDETNDDETCFNLNDIDE